MVARCPHCGAELHSPTAPCCGGAIAALLTPEDLADDVLDNVAHLFAMLGDTLMPELIRVRLHDGEDMEAGKALLYLMNAVLLDAGASDEVKTIADDCKQAYRAALLRHYRRRPIFNDCTED